MLNGKCGAGGCCHSGCVVKKTAKVVLIIGGLNWGLIGLGILLGSDLNVLNMILGSVPTLEAIFYLLVGVAAIMKIFGCRCSKCKTACAACAACATCAVDEKVEGKM